MKRIKKAKVVELAGDYPAALKVAPTVQATGILWMITLKAIMPTSSSSLKTPMVSPSIMLCRMIAKAKVDSVWEAICIFSAESELSVEWQEHSSLTGFIVFGSELVYLLL